MKRVLVTGAAGFIGRAVLPLLAEGGWEVLALSRRAHAEASGVRWLAAELFDRAAVDALLARHRPTHLLHLAWTTEHGRFWTAPENVDWLSASLALVQAFARHGGQRAVLAGSCAEYDWAYGHCREELTPCRPRSLYGETKLATSRLAARLLADTATTLAWARVFFPYGPGEAAGRLIPSTITAIASGAPVRCSHGAQYRDFLHVGDVARAFAHLLGIDDEGVFNIASGEPRRIREVVEAIARHMSWQGTPQFGAVTVPDDDPPLLVGDISRLAATGWQATVALDEGLDETIAWWRARPGNRRSP